MRPHAAGELVKFKMKFPITLLLVLVYFLLICCQFVTGVWHENVYCEEGEREGSRIYHCGDGWYYHLNRGDDDKMYFLCICFKRLGCTGRAIIHMDMGFRHSQGHENHRRDRHGIYPQYLRLRRNILERCRSLQCLSYSDILRQEYQRFPVLVASWIRMPSIRTAMRNARRAFYPPQPATLMGLTEILRDPQYAVMSLTWDGHDSVYGGSVTDSEGDHHVLLASHRMLRLMARVSMLFGDGTFKIVPAVPTLQNRRAQVFNIMASWNHHTILLASVLMESRTEEAYEAVFRLLRNHIPQWRFTHVVTDQETAQVNAWNTVFNPERIQTCLWHICKAFVLQIFALGLGHWFYERHLPQFRTIVRMACALPLLPAPLLRFGWRIVRREARLLGGNFLRNLMNPFFDYLWEFWVNNHRRRRQMSVFNSEHRTNNVCESLNSRLLRLLGVHPNVYEFIDMFIELEHAMYTDVAALLQGRQVSFNRKTTAIVNDRIIRNLSREILHPPMGFHEAVRRFLTEASNRVVDMVNQHIPQNPPNQNQ